MRTAVAPFGRRASGRVPCSSRGEIVGTWRRDQGTVTVRPWRRLNRVERDAVAAEAESLPLPGVEGGIAVWEA